MAVTAEMTEQELQHIEEVRRLTKDLRDASRLMDRDEVRYVVSSYYRLQDFRIALGHQVRKSGEHGEPNGLLKWVFNQVHTLEKQIGKALGHFSNTYYVGRWMRSICGVGPVIAAGLLSHIDVRRAKTAGAIWRYAGLDPSRKWKKGQKRPWNRELKCLCAFKLGESFVKVQNRDSDVYGKLFAARKEKEAKANEAGHFVATAQRQLKERNYGRNTEAFKALSSGRLPQAQIHARARRYAVKLFLSHLHNVMFVDYWKDDPPVPYILDEPGHNDYIKIPNWPFESSGRSLTELLGPPEEAAGGDE